MLKMKQDTVVRLPIEYQEVEYIESTGTQYIDTGIPLNQYRKCEMEFSPTLIGTTVDEKSCIDGGRNNSSQVDVNNSLFIYGGTKKLCLAYGNSSQRIDSIGLELNLKYIIKYELLANSCSLTINGNEYNTETGVTLITNSNNVFLFGKSNSASGQEPYTNLVSMRLYNAKYYNDNDILIRNFIPCYRKSDNKVGLYDLVNNQFYTNTGTGVFLMGEAVGTADVNLMPMIGNKKVKRAYLGNTLKYKSTKQIMLAYIIGASALKYSYDGITWQTLTITGSDFLDITYKDKYFYAVSTQGTGVYRSADLVTWNKIATGNTNTGNVPISFISNKNGFIGFNTTFASSVNINYSSNGTTWNYIKSTDSNKLDLYRIYNFNNIIIFTGKCGLFYKTKDEPLSEMIKSCHFTKINGTEYSSGTSLSLSFYRMLQN